MPIGLFRTLACASREARCLFALIFWVQASAVYAETPAVEYLTLSFDQTGRAKQFAPLIEPLETGFILDLAAKPSRCYRIQAHVNDAATALTFELSINGTLQTIAGRNQPPWTFTGSQNITICSTSMELIGEHVLTIYPCHGKVTGAGCSGELGEKKIISYSVIDSNADPSASIKARFFDELED